MLGTFALLAKQMLFKMSECSFETTRDPLKGGVYNHTNSSAMPIQTMAANVWTLKMPMFECIIHATCSNIGQIDYLLEPFKHRCQLLNANQLPNLPEVSLFRDAEVLTNMYDYTLPLKGRDALCYKFLGGLAPGIIHPSSNIESLTIVIGFFTIKVKIYLQKKF